MSTSQTNVIQIVKSNTELRTDKGVGWWSHLTGYTVRLEAIDSSLDKLNIISPSGYYRVSVDLLARNPLSCKGFLKIVPNLT